MPRTSRPTSPGSSPARSGSNTPICKRSLGAVDDEKGIAGKLVFKGSRVNGEITPQLWGTFDYGIPLPIPHSSVWLRTAAGAADGSKNETVANFYFGGFGNNYVDDKSIKRYHEYYSMPGFGIDEISGLNFVKELVEWNVPPYVFESAGTPGLYLNWLRPSVFAAGLVDGTGERLAAQGLRERRRAGRSALQRPALVRHDAVGRLRGRFSGIPTRRHEWMISLKIM